jgi:hypothetical protein
MIKSGTVQDGESTRRFLDMDKNPRGNSRGRIWRTDIIEADRQLQAGAQAFLVEQDPDSVLGVHFHFEHQFQVVVDGSGSLGRHPLEPFLVHFATGHTGYGPLQAGPAGLSYLTLRAHPDFAQPYFLPDMRDHMQALRKVNRHSVQATPSDASARRTRQDVSCEVLLPPEASGGAAWMLRVPPHRSAPVPTDPDCGGQFRVVVGGSMDVQGRQLGHLGCTFLEPVDCDTGVVAGPDGLDVLLLQFPRNRVAAPM